MLTGLLVNKVIAVSVGPSGFAIIGQFQSFVNMMSMLSGGAVSNGVIKYTAEYNNHPDERIKIWKMAGVIGISGGLLSGTLVLLTRYQLASVLLKDPSYQYVFIWLGCTLVMFSLNILLMAIINGMKQIKLYVIASISGSLISLIFTSMLTLKWNLLGTLIALAVNQSIILIVTLFIILKTKWFRVSYLWGPIDMILLTKLGKYALMTIVAAIVGPISQIFIRDYLGDTFGLDSAGYWQGINRISKMYLMLVTTPLVVYILPRFSEIKDTQTLRKELLNSYKIVMPIVIACGMIIYIFRKQIILLLFTSEFNEMHDLFLWQMMGDTAKIASWFLAYIIISKAMIRFNIFIEIIFSVTYILLMIVLTHYCGLQGATIAHLINYSAYFSIIFFILYKRGVI
jgi:polysaccharide transporter, PST family